RRPASCSWARPPPMPAPFPYTTLFRSVLLELMDHLELPAATLVGLSLGAAVSLGVARRAPDRVERMVLASAGGIQDRVTAHELRSEEHTSELQSRENLVCRLLLEKKKC